MQRSLWISLVMLLTLSGLLSACGQKGPLTLPAEDSVESAEPAKQKQVKENNELEEDE